MDTDENERIEILWDDDEQKKLLCSECLNILFPPKQLDCCGTRICGQCALQKSDGTLQCPDEECGELYPKILPDRGHERELLKQTIRCPICPENKIYPFKDLLNHLHEVHRYKCSDCEEIFYFPQARNHHREHLCNNRLMPCSLAEMGCTEQFKLSDFEKHCQSFEHQNILTEFCHEYVLSSQSSKQLSERREQSVIDEERREIHVALEEMNSVLEQIESFKSQMTNLKSQEEIIKTNLELCRTHLKENFDLFEKNGQSFEDLSNTFKQIREYLDRIQLKMNSTCHLLDLNNNFFWIINISDIPLQDRDIRSEPFQTCPNGYRMELRAKIVPKGKSNLCVTLAFLEGEYDPILRWPFAYSMTILLINLKNSSKTISHVIKGKFCSKTNGQMKNTYEISSLCSMDTINAKESGFIENNSIFLQYHCDFQ